MDGAEIHTGSQDLIREVRAFLCRSVHHKADRWLLLELPWVVIAQLLVGEGRFNVPVVDGVDIQDHLAAVLVAVHQVVEPECIRRESLDELSGSFLVHP